MRTASNPLTGAQNKVLMVIAEHGPIADVALVPLTQHMAKAHMSSSSIRTRRAELERGGFLRETGQLKMPSGRMATVWDIA